MGNRGRRSKTSGDFGTECWAYADKSKTVQISVTKPKQPSTSSFPHMDLCSGEQKDIALAHRRRRRSFSQRGKCRAMGKSEATRQGGVDVGTKSPIVVTVMVGSRCTGLVRRKRQEAAVKLGLGCMFPLEGIRKANVSTGGGDGDEDNW